jgi:hypothetical protein
MADIAVVMPGISLRDMQEFTLTELAEWRERARIRHTGGNE